MELPVRYNQPEQRLFAEILSALAGRIRSSIGLQQTIHT